MFSFARRILAVRPVGAAGSFAGFCLVSSDSDFTRLASRIREAGKRVYGFGEKKTPPPFVAACDRFIYTEVLSAREGAGPQAEGEAVVVG